LKCVIQRSSGSLPYDPAKLPQVDRIVQSWDFAFGDSGSSSYVVGQVWVRNLANKYLVRQVRGRFDFVETVRQLRLLSAWVEERFPKHASHPKLVENKANGPAVISALRREVGGLIAVEPRGSKEARAHAVAPELEGRNVHLPAPGGVRPRWVEELIEECAAFPNGANDDQVDAMTQALIRLAGGGARHQVRSGGYDPRAFADR
jgi:predicted phage terminase large subunit-like protein